MSAYGHAGWPADGWMVGRLWGVHLPWALHWAPVLLLQDLPPPSGEMAYALGPH